MTDVDDAIDLVRAGMMRRQAALLQLAAAALEANVKVRRFAETFVKGLNAGVRQTLVEHPDLAYVDAQLDGFYGDQP